MAEKEICHMMMYKKSFNLISLSKKDHPCNYVKMFHAMNILSRLLGILVSAHGLSAMTGELTKTILGPRYYAYTISNPLIYKRSFISTLYHICKLK
jgi:hypothetical protein